MKRILLVVVIILMIPMAIVSCTPPIRGSDKELISLNEDAAVKAQEQLSALENALKSAPANADVPYDRVIESVIKPALSYIRQALKDIELNSAQLANVHGTPTPKPIYTPEKSKEEREKNQQEHPFSSGGKFALFAGVLIALTQVVKSVASRVPWLAWLSGINPLLATALAPLLNLVTGWASGSANIGGLEIGADVITGLMASVGIAGAKKTTLPDKLGDWLTKKIPSLAKIVVSEKKVTETPK